jgi:quinol monooxygenase YgiN
MSQIAGISLSSLEAELFHLNPPGITLHLQDETKFGIVERYEQESSQAYHLANPIWKLFDPYVIPLLAKPMELSRFEEF